MARRADPDAEAALGDTMPGSEERIRILQSRARRGKPLFADAVLPDDHRGLQLIGSANGQPKAKIDVEQSGAIAERSTPVLRGGTFATRLRLLRRRRGMSLRVLAVASGVSLRGLHYLELGEREPQLDTILKLAAALGYPAELLVPPNP